MTSLGEAPYLVAGVVPAPSRLVPSSGGAKVPIYEFECQKCGKEFDLVLTVKQYEEKQYACPACKAREVEHLITSTNVITSRKS